MKRRRKKNSNRRTGSVFLVLCFVFLGADREQIVKGVSGFALPFRLT